VSHVALYRKYRSQTFGDLIGQDHVVRTLLNSINGGKVAHAYLFTGPRGTGKTSTARLLATAINCEVATTGEPCNECDMCRSITAGSNLDVVEMDAASESGVDNVRERIVQVAEYRPTMGRYKVFIIDEVHDLSGKAFDALLKTIEEPPAHVVFMLATTEYTKVPATIRSRCQRFEFHRASLSDLVSRLDFVTKAEGVEAEPAALSAIARMADGGYRDALSLLEQALLVGDGKLTLEGVYEQLGLIQDEAVDGLLGAMRDQKVTDVIQQLDRIYRQGREPRSIIESMVYRISDLTRAIYGVEAGGADATGEAALHAMGAKLGPEFLSNVRRRTAELQKGVREVTLPRLWLEAELISLSVPAPRAPVQEAPRAEAPVRAATHAPTAAPTQAAPPAAAASANTASSEAPKPRVKAKTPAAPTGNAELDFAHQAWSEVVGEISAMSRAASQHMPKSQILSIEGSTVTVGFSTVMTLDWVRDKPKLVGTIHQVWDKLTPGKSWKLEFVHDQANSQPAPLEDAVVERPLEGDRLDDVGRGILGDL
jgi:DNA polymerase-3 subunit gamma/tau